jgi:O-antigen ligase
MLGLHNLEWNHLSIDFRRQQFVRFPRATIGDGSGPAQRIRVDFSRFVVARSSPLNRLAFGFFCLFVFSIPWENLLMWSALVTVSHMLGVVALPMAVLAILESGRLRGLSVPLVLMALFVAWGCLSFFWTVDAEATTKLVISWVQNLGMVWLIWELAYERGRQLVLMRAYVFGTLVSAGDTIFSYLTGSKVLYQRYTASGFDPNDLALLLALSLPISFYLTMIHKHSRLVWIYRLHLLAAIFAIGLTGSRGVLIATLVALVYLPFGSVRMTFRKKCAFLLVGVTVVSFTLAFLPQTTWQRWGRIGSELEQGSWSGRKAIWAAGLELVREYPVLGVGAGGFRTATSSVLVAHNTFLSVLVEEGLVGFALFLLLILSLALPALRLPTVERNLWLVLLVTWAVGVSSLTWETKKASWFLLGLAAARLAARGVHCGVRVPRTAFVTGTPIG